MPPVLVDCPVHGPRPAPQIVAGSGGSRVIVENSYGSCPVCGITAPILSGEYTFHDHRTEARLRLTPAQARRLLTAAQWARDRIREDPSSEEAVARQLRATAEREAPALLKAVDTISSQRAIGIATWIMLLLTILTWWTSTQQHNLTESDVVRIVEEVQHAERQAEAPSESPRPSPRPTAEPPKSSAPEAPQGSPAPLRRRQ